MSLIKKATMGLTGLALLANLNCEDPSTPTSSDVNVEVNIKGDEIDFSISGYVTAPYSKEEPEKIMSNVMVRIGDFIDTTDRYGHYQIVGSTTKSDSIKVILSEDSHFDNYKALVSLGQQDKVFDIRLLPKEYCFYGRVQDSDGNPRNNLKVYLSEGIWYIKDSMIPDENGNFSFIDIPIQKDRVPYIYGQGLVYKNNKYETQTCGQIYVPKDYYINKEITIICDTKFDRWDFNY